MITTRRVAMLCAAIGLLGTASIAPASAETAELRVGIQDGLAYLPFIMMDRQKLVEKHAQASGIGALKVTWGRFASGVVMNDGLLSGNLDIATGGVPGFLVLWAKTKGTKLDVRSVGAWASVPNYLNVRNPAVRSVKDLTDKDRIALPAVKVSNQAMYLQILAAETWGADAYQKLDPLTVSLAHSDAMTAMLSPGTEITAHFTIEPYASRERQAGARTLLSSFDIMGGPATTSVIYATGEFYAKNPKVAAAFVAALDEAFASIARDKKAAAEFYIAATGTKETREDIAAMLNDPLLKFGLAPSSVVKQAAFMHRLGTIKVKPESWQELFFAHVHALGGS